MQECIGTPAFADFKGENMLYIADDIHKIKYGLLMELYAQDLQKDAQKHYGRLSLNEGIFCAEQDFYAYLRDEFFKIRGAYYAFWVECGVYYSGLRLEPWKDGLVLCGIATRPDCRRKGYAYKLLQQVLQQLPCGTKVYSHIDKNNLASLALHHKIGFQLLEDHAEMLDGSFLHNFCTFLYGE